MFASFDSVSGFNRLAGVEFPVLTGSALQEADTDPTGEASVKTQQMLTYYELDLGLNHVVRKYSEQLEEHANFLITGQFEPRT